MLREIVITHEPSNDKSLDCSKSTMNSSMSSLGLRESTNSQGSDSRREDRTSNSTMRRSNSAVDLMANFFRSKSSNDLNGSSRHSRTSRRSRRREGRTSISGSKKEQDETNPPPLKQYSKEDQSKEARRARRRRSSMCHVPQAEDDEDARSVSSSRSLKSSLSLKGLSFGKKNSSAHTPRRSKKTQKRLSKEAELLRSMEEMEELVRAIKKNPESKKLLQQHLHKKHPDTFAPVDFVKATKPTTSGRGA